VDISNEGLRVLAAYDGLFTGHEPIGRWQGGERDASGAMSMPWYEYSDEVNRFRRDMAVAGFVQPVDWMSWAATPEGLRLVRDPSAIGEATRDELVFLLTTIICGERFSDGQIAAAHERGTLLAITERARALLDGVDGGAACGRLPCRPQG